jgi:hypothetical protein
MKRERIVVMAAAACLSFGSTMNGVVVGAGTAQAMPNSSGHDFIYPKGVCTNEACANQWCRACRCHAAPAAPIIRSIRTGTWASATTSWSDTKVQTRRPGSKGPPKSLRASSRETPGGGPGPCNGQPICLPGL